jgi:hypothetical protein
MASRFTSSQCGLMCVHSKALGRDHALSNQSIERPIAAVANPDHHDLCI